MTDHEPQRDRINAINVKTTVYLGDIYGKPVKCSGKDCKTEIGKDAIGWVVDDPFDKQRIWCTKECITRTLTKD